MRQRFGEIAPRVRLTVRRLPGGISAQVALVSARFTRGTGRRGCHTFVVKIMEGSAAREATIYQTLVPAIAREFSPELLGVARLGRERWLLYLEYVAPARPWPWTDTAHAARVLEHLGRLHTAFAPAEAGSLLPAWDYEAELLTSARASLELAERCAARGRSPALRRSMTALRRLVSALPEIRRQLLAFTPLGRVVIHGDVHPGNAIVERRTAGDQPVLLDWARTRVGSPLEDVSSWLQSLAYWEPEARRRHDTLLSGYFTTRGLARRLDRDLRDAYWLAAASNVLSGALWYQLTQAYEAGDAFGAARAAAHRAAEDWLRVLRRADACWSGASRG